MRTPEFEPWGFSRNPTSDIEDTRGATARPTSAKTPPPFPYSCQLNQLGRHLRGDARPPGQLSKHLRGGMQIFVKTLPPHQLSSQRASVVMHA